MYNLILPLFQTYPTLYLDNIVEYIFKFFIVYKDLTVFPMYKSQLIRKCLDAYTDCSCLPSIDIALGNVDELTVFQIVIC